VLETLVARGRSQAPRRLLVKARARPSATRAGWTAIRRGARRPRSDRAGRRTRFRESFLPFLAQCGRGRRGALGMLALRCTTPGCPICTRATSCGTSCWSIRTTGDRSTGGSGACSWTSCGPARSGAVLGEALRHHDVARAAPGRRVRRFGYEPLRRRRRVRAARGSDVVVAVRSGSTASGPPGSASRARPTHGPTSPLTRSTAGGGRRSSARA
jgi:hypothetical protein